QCDKSEEDGNGKRRRHQSEHSITWMRSPNDIVNEKEMKWRCQRCGRPNRALTYELPLKNEWKNGEDSSEAEVQKKRKTSLFTFDMSEMPGVLEQDGGAKRNTREQIERKDLRQTEQQH